MVVVLVLVLVRECLEGLCIFDSLEGDPVIFVIGTIEGFSSTTDIFSLLFVLCACAWLKEKPFSDVFVVVDRLNAVCVCVCVKIRSAERKPTKEKI